MIINVSFDGRKLFNWEGGTAEATKIEEDVGEVAALANMTPETLWQSTLAKIAANGGWVFSGNPEPEMMIVIAGLLALPTHHPDHPGHCRDYLEVSNFDFDIKNDPQNSTFHINVRAFAEGALQ
jgi:hypothetical protein